MATAFWVRASAGRGSFSVSLFSADPLILKADIPEQPENGRANRALLSGLEDLLGCKVSLLSGANARRKRLAADCTGEELVRKILQNCKQR